MCLWTNLPLRIQISTPMSDSGYLPISISSTSIFNFGRPTCDAMPCVPYRCFCELAWRLECGSSSPAGETKTTFSWSNQKNTGKPINRGLGCKISTFDWGKISARCSHDIPSKSCSSISSHEISTKLMKSYEVSIQPTNNHINVSLVLRFINPIGFFE